MLRHLLPDLRWSEITTRRPASARSETIFDPMNPAPPVTTIGSSSERFCIADIAPAFLGKRQLPSGGELRHAGSMHRLRLFFHRALYDDPGDHWPRYRVQQREEFLQLI